MTSTALQIAHSLSKHRYSNGGNDYTPCGENSAWTLDTFIDEDYVLGALLVIATRVTDGGALNEQLEHLAVARFPGDRFDTEWFMDEKEFFEAHGDWSTDARVRFLSWYEGSKEWWMDAQKADRS